MAVKLFALAISNCIDGGEESFSAFFMKKIFLLILLVSCQNPPAQFGIQSCAGVSYCVSSFDSGNESYLPPIESEEDPQRIRQKIKGIVSKTAGANIVEESENYLRAEYSSSLLGFIDDVEFWFHETHQVHFKSASRGSFPDFGANKERIESLRFKFHQNDF